MQRDIDLQQIISVLNFSTTDQDHMSFRLSDDYHPNYFRYSKDDELQEITFNLEGEDEEGFQISADNQPQLNIKEESPQDRICFILEDFKEESVKLPPPQQKPHTIDKKASLNRKTSIRASELLKRKISVKKENDQFGKKYDDLFDEIFFKERSKQRQEEQKEPPKKEVLEKKEESLISTNENLSGSNVTSVTSDTNFSISRAIDEAIVNSFNSLTNIAQPKNSNQKVMITYETKILINILPPKEHGNTEVVQTNNARPKIKFSYGQAQAQIVAKKQVLLEGVPNQIREENRLPQFIVSFRSKTNSYPNFYSKNGFTHESCRKVNDQFVQILHQCKKSIQALKQCHFVLHQLFNNIKQLYKMLSLNILSHNSKEDQALLDYFLSHPWNDYLKTKELQAIRPRDYFLARPFNELEFITFINGFEEVALRLQSEALLNADNPETIKAYMSGRDQLWAIEKNLRLLSEDLYLYAISHFNLPSHFLQTHTILKSVNQNEKLNMNAESEQLLKRLLFLQDNKDILGSSWVGHYAVECLCSLRK